MKASLGAGYGLCLRLILEVDSRSSRGQSSEFGLMTRSVAEDVGDCALDRAPPLKNPAQKKKISKNFSEAAAAGADAEEEGEGRGVKQALHCVLLSLSSQCLRLMHSSKCSALQNVHCILVR